MLFRAVAPVDTVKKVLKDLGPEQHGQAMMSIFKRFCDPESRQVLTLQASPEKWKKLLGDTLATSAKVNNWEGGPNVYQNKDVIWLSSLESDADFLSDAEFDLFIHEV